MRFEIKRLIRPLQLGEYASEYGDAALEVWINPPKALSDTRLELAQRTIRVSEALSAGDADAAAQLDAIGNELIDWLAQIWSAGDQTISADEIREIFDADPALYRWLLEQTWQMLIDFRAGQKKS